MALFDGLLGGGSADPYDLYGDILTTKQREALRARSTDDAWANTANFLAKAAMPTNKKIPFGGLLAGLAGAMRGGSQDEAVQTAFKGAHTMAQIAKLRKDQAVLDRLGPYIEEGLALQIARSKALAGGGVPPAAGAPAVPPTAPAAGPATPPPGGAPLPSWSAGVPSQDLSRWGMPMRPRGGPLSATAAEVSSEDRPLLPIPPAPPGGRITPADYGVPGSQSSLDPAALQGLLAMAGGGGGGGGDDIWSQLASMQGGAAPGTPPFDLASLGQGQGLPDLGQVQVEPLSGEASPAGRSWERDDPLIRKYESGNRNIMQGVVGPEGGYNPSVGRVTGPSSAGGYYQMIDPTWRGAAAKAGIDTKEYPRAIDAPFEVQQTVAKKLYEDEGLRPWAPYNRNLAAATGYSGGLPDVGRVRTEPLGGEATPAGGQSGLVPGLGVTPEALALMNAMAKLGGIDSPFGSLLETYYKSPGYLGEAETAKERAKIKEQEPFEQRKKQLDFLLDMRKNGFLIDDKGQVQEDPSYAAATGRRAERSEDLKLEYQKKQKAFEEQIKIQEELRGDQREIKEQPVYQGGVIVNQPMTRADAVARLKDQSMRPGQYKDGDIVAKPADNLSPDHRYRMTPQGVLSVEPIAGTPAAEKAAEAANKRLQNEQQRLIGRDVVVTEVDNIKKEMKNAILPTTGFVGSILQNLGGTAANSVRIARQTLEARMSTDAINAMRAASPTGAALGNASDTDMAILRTALANLDQSQNEEQLLERLERVKQIYVDTVHGPGASRLLPETPVLKPPAAAATPPTTPGAPREGIYNPKTGRVEYK